MKNWLRRLTYLLIIIVWLIIMAFPITAFAVSMRGQLQFGQDNRPHLRLFMVQEEDANGIGIEWAKRPFRHRNCLQTTLQYIMWEGQSEPATFCQCIDPETEMLQSSTAQCGE